MTRQYFVTRTELERQMDAARQLRAETLAGAGWIFSAFGSVAGVIRRIVRRTTAHAPRQA